MEDLMFWNRQKKDNKENSRKIPKNNKKWSTENPRMWEKPEEDLIKEYILHNGPGIDIDDLISKLGSKLRPNHRTRDSITSKITRIKEFDSKNFGSVFCIRKSKSVGESSRRINASSIFRYGGSLELNKATKHTSHNKALKFLDTLPFDTSEYQVMTITSDDHIPFDDRELWKRFLEFAHYLKPNAHVYNGDLIDCEELNRFPKDHRLRLSKEELDEILKSCSTDDISGDFILKTKIQREVDLAYNKMLEFNEASPNTEEKTYNVGNHEFRLDKFIKTQSPQLFGLHRAKKPDEPSILDWGYLTRCDELGVRYNNAGTEQSWIEWNGVKIGHFNKVTKHSAYAAKNLMDEMLCSLVQGHTHRMGSHYRTTRSKDNRGNLLFGIEGGCMCYTSAEYTKDPNWQNSWTILAFDGENVYPETISYLNGKYLIGGKLFSA